MTGDPATEVGEALIARHYGVWAVLADDVVTHHLTAADALRHVKKRRP